MKSKYTRKAEESETRWKRTHHKHTYTLSKITKQNKETKKMLKNKNKKY